MEKTLSPKFHLHSSLKNQAQRNLILSQMNSDQLNLPTLNLKSKPIQNVKVLESIKAKVIVEVTMMMEIMMMIKKKNL
jgi:hypothetical protein